MTGSLSIVGFCWKIKHQNDHANCQTLGFSYFRNIYISSMPIRWIKPNRKADWVMARFLISKDCSFLIYRCVSKNLLKTQIMASSASSRLKVLSNHVSGSPNIQVRRARSL